MATRASLGLFESARGRRHAETLAPGHRVLLTTADIALEEISVVAVDVGPGLFTGLRVGIATAKAIAHALRVPMIGISSLDLLAFPLRHTVRTIVTVIDARRGELFYAFYRQVPGGVQRWASCSSARPTSCRPTCWPRTTSTCWSATARCATATSSAERKGVEFAEQWLAHPSAAPLVQLAHARALREDWVNPWELEPIYLRKPDAVDQLVDQGAPVMSVTVTRCGCSRASTRPTSTCGSGR